MALGRTWRSLLTIVRSRLHPQQPWRVPSRVGEGPGKVTVCTPPSRPGPPGAQHWGGAFLTLGQQHSRELLRARPAHPSPTLDQGERERHPPSTRPPAPIDPSLLSRPA